jgi:hypothetical protein
MKKEFALFVFIATLFFLSREGLAQQRNCATMEYMQWLKENNPTYAKSFEQNERLISKWIKNHPQQKTLSSDTIPVVVHVLWNSFSENISDEQIQSQIDVLNEDWARTNADKASTPVVWQSISGSLPYRFKLACKDPNGNLTTGIVRVHTNEASFTADNKIKFNSLGGSDAWNTDKYLNIWVGHMCCSIIGYAEFPSLVHTNTFGLVMNTQSFGRVRNVSSPYNRGRTATHELGHCFNLFHIWGDDGGDCTGSDSCADTPNQFAEHYRCVSFPSTDGCSSSSPGVMFMNYMDYTDDACMNMFTQNQTARMDAALNLFYPSLLSTDGLSCPALVSVDAGIIRVEKPENGNCETTFSPKVILKNFGANTLTYADVYFSVDGASPSVFNWNGSLATSEEEVITLNSVSSSIGVHTFKVYSANPNHVADALAENDTTKIDYEITDGYAFTPEKESFESLIFPPINYFTNNFDSSFTWERTKSAHKKGDASMFINNFNYDKRGSVDEFVLPQLNISSIENPQLIFYVAYSLYSNPEGGGQHHSDTLEILLSTDCGNSWTSVYKKFGTALTTSSSVYSSGNFVPSTDEWRKERVALGEYESSKVLIKFRNITDFENNLYIDDINITSSISSDDGIIIYPNPSTGTFFITNTLSSEREINLQITNTLGEIMSSESLHLHSGETLQYNAAFLSRGIYFITMRSDAGTATTKLSLTK